MRDKKKKSESSFGKFIYSFNGDYLALSWTLPGVGKLGEGEGGYKRAIPFQLFRSQHLVKKFLVEKDKQ